MLEQLIKQRLKTGGLTKNRSPGTGVIQRAHINGSTPISRSQQCDQLCGELCPLPPPSTKRGRASGCRWQEEQRGAGGMEINWCLFPTVLSTGRQCKPRADAGDWVFLHVTETYERQLKYNSKQSTVTVSGDSLSWFPLIWPHVLLSLQVFPFWTKHSCYHHYTV